MWEFCLNVAVIFVKNRKRCERFNNFMCCGKCQKLQEMSKFVKRSKSENVRRMMLSRIVNDVNKWGFFLSRTHLWLFVWEHTVIVCLCPTESRWSDHCLSVPHRVWMVWSFPEGGVLTFCAETRDLLILSRTWWTPVCYTLEIVCR